MILFPSNQRINEIKKMFPDDTCGSVSAAIVFEKFKLDFDPQFFISNGRDGKKNTNYPENGSSVIGTALAIASTGIVDVEVYSEFDIINDYGTLESYEKPIVDELKTLNNVIFYQPISIDDVISKLSVSCIPILAFNRNGDDKNGHFSPLRGFNSNFLLLPLNDSFGSCNCDKDTFSKIWWKHKVCILVKKKVNAPTP